LEEIHHPIPMNAVRFLRSIAAAGLMIAASQAARAGDLDFHFRLAPIPAPEARLMELARIREFRGGYELGEVSQGTLLIAELHEKGQPTRAFRLARAKYDRAKQSRTGTLAFGWHRDARQLVSVHDNGDLYSPWVAKIDLPDFAPLDAHWFEDSAPEERKPDRDGGFPFRLYPVMGLCGERSLQISYSDVKTGGDFVKACHAAGAKSAVVIYLYLSPFDEQPSMKFENGSQPAAPAAPAAPAE
jgi:hypothetical protein